MDLTKRQAEYWAFILALMITIAVAVLLIDFAIKTAILEESNKLRMMLEAEEVRRNGQKPKPTDAGRAANISDNNPSIPGDVLVVDTPGMETGNVHNGTKEAATGQATRRPKPRRSPSPRTIPGGNE